MRAALFGCSSVSRHVPSGARRDTEDLLASKRLILVLTVKRDGWGPHRLVWTVHAHGPTKLSKHPCVVRDLAQLADSFIPGAVWGSALGVHGGLDWGREEAIASLWSSS